MTQILAAAARLHPRTSHYYGYYGAGRHFDAPRTLALILVLVLGYTVLHVVFGLGRHGYHRSRGHRGNLGWSLRRGPWASYRVGRHTTVYEDL